MVQCESIIWHVVAYTPLRTSCFRPTCGCLYRNHYS